MLQKFVYWTGAFDIVVGAATWYGAISNPQAGQLVALMTLGMFLMMAVACLMWASRDMENRAPVIFWQGLVRLTAVATVLYAVPNELASPYEYRLVVFNGVIGLTYVLGMTRVTGCSPIQLLQCQTAANQVSTD